MKRQLKKSHKPSRRCKLKKLGIAVITERNNGTWSFVRERYGVIRIFKSKAMAMRELGIIKAFFNPQMKFMPVYVSPDNQIVFEKRIYGHWRD